MTSKNQNGFFIALFSPTPYLLPTYVAGFVFTSLLVTFLYAILTDTVTTQGILYVLIVGIISFAVAYWAWAKHKSFTFYWAEGKPLPKYKGLVVILSTPDIVRQLLKHHGSELQHLWIITNFENRAYSLFFSETLPSMRHEFEEQNIKMNFSPHPIHYDQSKSTDAKNAYLATKQAFEEASKYGLRSSEIVADITSGTKEMTTGMALACTLHQWPMSYVRSTYEWIEKEKRHIRKPGTEEVLELDVSFIPSSNTD